MASGEVSLENVLVVRDMGECGEAFIFAFRVAGEPERRVVVGPCGIGRDGQVVNVGSAELTRVDFRDGGQRGAWVESARYYAWYQAVGGDLNETIYGALDEVMPRLEELARTRNVSLSSSQLDTVRRRFEELALRKRYDARAMRTLDDPLDYFRTIFLRVLAATSTSQLSLEP